MTPQSVSVEVLQEKYAKNGETSHEEIFARVAKGIAKVERNSQLRKKWEGIFLENMRNGGLGAGRIMSAGGTGIGATLINCFVQGVGDAIEGLDEEGLPGIYEAIKESACTMRRGGGVGYNFSKIRPKGSVVKGVSGLASGPCSYMNIFDQSCGTIESAGSRRGAQMGVLNINHPDIEEFVTAKRTEGRWRNFNVSVMVTDSFMELKNADGDLQLVHKATPGPAQIEAGAYQRSDGLWVYKTIKARDLWDMIMKSNYDFAEPGILFYDNINKDNNLNYIEEILATNPCGEQPLPNYACCDLGPINLSLFVSNPFTPKAKFDYQKLVDVTTVQTRFLDNVLDVTLWPLAQQKKEAMDKRRIGIGFTALANTLAMLNKVYYSEEGLKEAEKIMTTIRDAAYSASVELAKEKKPFPLFNADKYLAEGTFASRLPKSIKDNIRKHGIRNSHLLSIAPTGTISLAFCDNASNGIEPPYSLAYTRKKRITDTEFKFYPVVDHGLRVFLSTMEDKALADALLEAICQYRDEFEYNGTKHLVKGLLPKSLVTAMEMKTSEHVAMMKTIQPLVDTSISKTVNVPADYPFEDFKGIYDDAWQSKLKGISTYRPNSILGSVLSVPASPKEETKEKDIEYKDNLNVFIEKRPPGTLDSKTRKVVYLTSSYQEDSFYVGLSFLPVEQSVDGENVIVNRPIEVFFTVCPDGVPQEWLDQYAISTSILARAGLDVFCKALRAQREVKSDKGQVRYGWFTKADGSNVPKFHSSEVACMSYAIQEILQAEGIIDPQGFPIKNMKPLTKVEPAASVETREIANNIIESNIVSGKQCKECGAHAVIKVDGCSKCTNCGALGECG